MEKELQIQRDRVTNLKATVNILHSELARLQKQVERQRRSILLLFALYPFIIYLIIEATK